jgi:hypothetical protein
MSLQKVSSFVSVLVLFSLLFCAVFFTGYIHRVFAQTAEQANASCQPAKEREGAKCNATAQGAIIQGTCQGGVCKATSAENTQGKQEKVNENTTEIQKGAQEKANEVNAEPANPNSSKLQGRLGDDPTAYASKDDAGTVDRGAQTDKAGNSFQSTRPMPGDDAPARGWDNLANESAASRDSILESRDTYVRNTGNSSYDLASFGNMFSDGDLGGMFSFLGSDNAIDFSNDSGRVFDYGFNSGFDGSFQSDLRFISNAELRAGGWDGSSNIGVGSYSGAGYQMDAVSATGFGSNPASPFISSGGSNIPTFNNGSLTQAASYQGNTSAVVWGAGASPGPSAYDVLRGQTIANMQAQTNAQNAGTIGNYLADGTPAPQTFGQYVAQGLSTAWEGTKSAFEAVSDAFITPAAAEPAPSAENDSWTGAFSDNTTYSPPESSVPTSDLPGIANGVLPSADVPGIISPPAATYIPADTAQQAQLPDYTSSAFKEATLPDYAQGLRNTQMAPVTEAASPFGIPRAVETVNPMSGITVEVDRSGVPVPNVASADTGRGPFDGFNNLASQGFKNTTLADSNFPGGSDSANTRMPVNPGDMSGMPDMSRTGAPAASNAAPGAQESSGQGGMGDIAGMLKSLMGMMKGGGGGGGSQQSSAPPVTAASSTILATSVPATQFVPPAPLTPAPQVSLIANPNPTEKNTGSIISWTSVWQQEQPATTTRECAVINAAGNTLTDHASTTGSYETQALSRATYFLVGCKQTGGKLGSAQVLVGVKGDTQAPLVPAKDALDYESTSGVSTAASDLSRALNPAPQNQPSQQVEVACDPNSQSYFDCLTGKMQFVDKLF